VPEGEDVNPALQEDEQLEVDEGEIDDAEPVEAGEGGLGGFDGASDSDADGDEGGAADAAEGSGVAVLGHGFRICQLRRRSRISSRSALAGRRGRSRCLPALWMVSAGRWRPLQLPEPYMRQID